MGGTSNGHLKNRVLLTGNIAHYTNPLTVGNRSLIWRSIIGGSGFIASHILDTLLDAGFQVAVTARSEEKGKRIVDSVKPKPLSYVVVDDIAKGGAFDVAFQSEAAFDYVVHTASPYHLNPIDPVKEFLEPAINGTKGLLKSIKTHAPTVKRLVITSSSAAILNPANHAKVYDETCWAPTTWEEAMEPKKAYKASKVFSEKAAWAFIEEEKPNFDLAVINCTYVFGPIQRNLPSLDAMNASNHRVREMVQGKMKEALAPTAPVFTFVDVRDVALAHLRAMTLPQAGGNRFYVVGGHFSNKQIADVIRKSFPQLKDRLPLEADTVDDIPDDVYHFDNSKSREVLGLEYTSLERSVVDTVQSILDLTPVS
ncbi:Uu.00g108850.m01.CDS01 [Anthostomella pinea]|uniref:Uu.00g108850.m01.CDS01 n=1 Tax=Anthostomella pinea TaxID=933095 RepID=A0AAI8YDP8_9PEZI|nr:Uu.00g108850.m01.CDS01 [Anthostomella pinea]